MSTVDVNAIPKEVVDQLFWRVVWPQLRDRRWQGKIWIFRPSIRFASLKDELELLFGKAPPDA